MNIYLIMISFVSRHLLGSLIQILASARLSYMEAAMGMPIDSYPLNSVRGNAASFWDKVGDMFSI